MRETESAGKRKERKRGSPGGETVKREGAEGWAGEGQGRETEKARRRSRDEASLRSEKETQIESESPGFDPTRR